MVRYCSVAEAKALVHGGGESALLDVREAAEHGDGHPLFAVPCPYSRLEASISILVPRRTVPVLLVDDNDGRSETAARRLEAIRYPDVRVVAGGTAAWAADHHLFPGVNVPSKVLGELLEHAWRPASIDAGTLLEWRAAGRQFRLFDVRPPAEYARMCIPGSENMPNGELAHRLGAVIPDPTIPIVLTCAGRTRGIVGAAGLRLAGIPNPVYALENGTQGWTLSGNELVRNAGIQPLPPLSDADRSASRRRANAVIEAEGLRRLGPLQRSGLLEDDSRTTFIFDLRDPAEAVVSRTVPGAVHAPGVQLVQATDAFMGVRHARVVLVDDTGLRAALAATFLSRMSYETYVAALDDGPIGDLRDVSTAPQLHPTTTVGPAQALALIHERRVPLLDLRSSTRYDGGHPSGAIWSIRPRLSADLPAGTREILIVADDPGVAAMAAIDLREMGVSEPILVEGDLAGWRDAGGEVEENPPPLPRDRAIDMVWFTYGRHDGDREASLRYLAWEQGIVGQLDPCERAEFRI